MATELLIREYNEIADNTAIEQSKKSEVNDEQLIMKALDTLEFDADTKGYIFLVEIIKSGLKDINNIIPIIQKGYPNVARIFETTPIRVERAIRTAIETANSDCKIVESNYIHLTLEGKPTNLEFIINIVEYLCSVKNNVAQELTEITSDKYVRKLLKTLGISVQLKGYAYLIEIINLGLDDINKIIPITQKGYPNVARIFETTPIRVERAIRNAIETAIICGNLETWNYVFGNSYSALKGKPTNTKFIITLVEYLKSLIKVPKSITESTSINEKSVAKTLKLLGISTKRKGYKYLIEFIKLGVNDFNSVSTFEIGCFNVAKGFNTTTKSVASCIRLAVKQSNDSVEFVDPETWNKIFGNSHLKGHVSNAEFIRALINFFVK